MVALPFWLLPKSNQPLTLVALTEVALILGETVLSPKLYHKCVGNIRKILKKADSLHSPSDSHFKIEQALR